MSSDKKTDELLDDMLKAGEINKAREEKRVRDVNELAKFRGNREKRRRAKKQRRKEAKRARAKNKTA